MAAATAVPQRRVRHGSEVPKITKQGWLTPWLYLGPALLVMLTFLIYPGINTLYLSFRNANGMGWAAQTCISGQPCWGILENYRYILTSQDMLTAFFNTLKWILLMVPGCVAVGLLVATLASRVRYEALARSVIFLPMVISFVGAGVIWKFVYDYGTGQQQLGLLNAIVTSLGGQPVSWLSVPQVNTIALSIGGIWMWSGFCVVILTIAVKDVPHELVDAARTDGASEWLIFQHVTLPHIVPTLTVVVVTLIINVLKIFDIVYIMTSGNYGTEVIANRMYIEQYANNQTGRAAAIAIVLVVLIVPAMIYNVRFLQQQETSR